MAKTPKPATPGVIDGADYDVTLKGVAMLGRLRLLPRDSHVISGAGLKIVLRDYPDAVEAYAVKEQPGG